MMAQKNSLKSQTNPISLAKRMLAGAGIGLFLISLFLISAPEANPAWGKFWMIRPLIIVPLAGSMGGLCSYFIIHFLRLVGINKTVAVILSLIVFTVGLWMGSILGLDGTWWD